MHLWLQHWWLVYAAKRLRWPDIDVVVAATVRCMGMVIGQSSHHEQFIWEAHQIKNAHIRLHAASDSKLGFDPHPTPPSPT